MARLARFVQLDGIDGSGKDSQADLLVQHFRAAGLDPLRLNEPDNTLPTGTLLRQLLKSGEYQEAHAALFLADRMAMLTRRVIPALAAGRPVVSSRSFLSTLVYQQENWPLEWLLAIHAQLPAKADLLIVLDMDPTEALARTQKRGLGPEVYERLDIQRRNQKRYRDLVLDPCIFQFLAPGGQARILDASGTPEQVQERVLSLLAERSC